MPKKHEPFDHLVSRGQSHVLRRLIVLACHCGLTQVTAMDGELSVSASFSQFSQLLGLRELVATYVLYR